MIKRCLAPLFGLGLLLTSGQATAAGESSPDDIPGQVAIDLVDDLPESEVDAVGTEIGVKLAPASFLSARTHVFTASSDADGASRIIARLQADRRVENVEPVAWVRASFVPNDPLWEQQWHMQRVGAASAWNHTVGRGVVVAVVDTGVACEDREPFSRGSDLADTWCVDGFDFVANQAHASDDNGHGTHVAGTIAQSTNNGIGATGLAFRSRILPVKVLDRRGMGTTVAVADGIRYAADNGAHVINLSLGGSRPSRLMSSAIQYARSKGVVVVAAAGNNGAYVEYPAAFDGVIAVSAVNAQGNLAEFSSRGPQVDIAAPGVGVLQQTICNGGHDRCELFREMSGTSMAAPHVSAAAALLVSLGVTNPDKVERALLDAAKPPSGVDPGGPLFGAGIVDAAGAVSSMSRSILLVRFGWIAALTVVVAAYIRKQRGDARVWHPLFVAGCLAFGVGLGFFAPWVASRAPLWLDILSRPIPEWDMFIGASVHRWLLLSHALVPIGLSALFYGAKSVRPAIAGASIGTAAYLLSVATMGHIALTSRGSLMLWGWAVLNTLVCLWIARLTLDRAQ